eukprot:TRINITY_DN1728_c0_g1_i3.p1 TRINITY_DN1728_c0_g1~~TRINITY_DN1728_c0_g1_i3.p1  ORF type:complete len:245 (+),score=25.64 TRINITY_DN1728_c0_g1_i3:245-979(+)
MNLQHIQNILRPLFQMTKWLSLEQIPTIGLLMPAIFQLLFRVETSDAHQELPMMCLLLKKTLLLEIQRSTLALTTNIAYEVLVALVLDPRTKDLWFIQDAEIRKRYISSAMEHILKEVDKIHPEYGKISPIQEVFGAAALSQTAQSSQEELFAYSTEKKMDIGYYQNGKFILNNPMNWWVLKEPAYPKLAQVARKYLCLPVSSLPSERVFSKAGWLVSKRRCSLGDDNVSNLAFIAANNCHLNL